MTDARIAHKFPDISQAQALVATLGKTLGMARDMKLMQQDIKEDGVDERLIEDILGQPEEIKAAEKAVTSTVLAILSQVTEQDLKEGHDREFLSPDDYQEALKVWRKMSLTRGRTEQERDHER